MISKTNETKIKPQILRDHEIFEETKIANHYSQFLFLSEEKKKLLERKYELNIFGIVAILSNAEKCSLQHIYIKAVLMRKSQSS